MRRLFVTGRHGFVGSALVRRVAERHADEWEVLDVPPALDLRDLASVHALVAAARPDAVIHLAAQSAVPDALRDPETTLNVNLLGTLHLLQALDAHSFRGRLLYVGSGDVYGNVPEDCLPVNETWLPHPRNPYAVSKLAAEALCWQWHASEGMRVVLARPFNHIGPGQSDRFVVSSMARQLAEIRRGTRSGVIRVGRLDTSRDFTDVRDVVDAYLALLRHGEPGEVYNVCSGVERAIGSVLEQLIVLAGVDVRAEEEQARVRSSEQIRMRGDPGKLIRATGWQPKIPIEVSLFEVLAYWEQLIDG